MNHPWVADASFPTASGPHGDGEPETETERLRSWVGELPVAEKNDLLTRLLTGSGTTVRGELLRRYHAEHPVPGSAHARRTAGMLWEAAQRGRAERERLAAEADRLEQERRERFAAAERQRHLDLLAVDQPGAWERVAAFVETRTPRGYDDAVQLLVDLRDISEREGTGAAFARRFVQLRSVHIRKPTLLQRMMAAGLDA